MKKKNRCIFFLRFFQLLEIVEKKIFIMKKKKNLCRTVLGYCPNYIVKKKKLYCKAELYCSLRKKKKKHGIVRLYCNEGLK